ncbi:hypothetical protein [Szabonella alba]|uniref:N-acetyltransferase domain-containing protein n=1 Tax=Szabonella alba TaxID=2804194 RepID=A0A8K0VG83_9RHOB|nr:hypothetical protein [Szabonella alba]MBL4918475.1 hypothetical protein [Szabonella alba]
MTRETLKAEGASLTIHLDGPVWDGVQAATIGDVAFRDPQAGAALLGDALARIRAAGRDRVLGPMAGDTWHSYRFVSESDGSKPFLLEPSNRPEEPAIFADAGFRPVAHYFSARMALTGEDPPPPPADARFRITAWDGAAPEDLFREVFALSCAAFAGNAFYTPIDEAAFLAMYRPVMPMMTPDLILLARRPDGSLAGYLFAIPNLVEGPKTKTVILKTYASLERGAGRHLIHACHKTARAMGFETVIHALIHDDNISAERSRREGADVFRRYALMGLPLDV